MLGSWCCRSSHQFQKSKITPAQRECSLNGAVAWLWGASLRQCKKYVGIIGSSFCHPVSGLFCRWFNHVTIMLQYSMWFNLKPIETLNLRVHRFILFHQLCLRPPPPPQPQATLAGAGGLRFGFWWLRMSQFAKRLKDPKGPKVFLRWIGLNRMVQYDSTRVSKPLLCLVRSDILCFAYALPSRH